MSNYNKVLLLGRLTRDPELKYTPQGVAVTEIGLAINREYTVGTERRKETTFVDVTFWRRQAEVICQYMKKGGPVFVEGRLVTDSWETPEGQKRTKLKVLGDNFQFVGGRSGDAEGYASGGAESQADPGSPPPQGGSGGWKKRSEWDDAGAPADGGARRGSPGGRGAVAAGGPSRQASPEPEEEGPEGVLGLGENDVPF
jgi:single-strand DNA-binding protein